MQEAIFLKPLIYCNGQGPLCLYSTLYLNHAEVSWLSILVTHTLYKGMNTHVALQVRPQTSAGGFRLFLHLVSASQPHSSPTVEQHETWVCLTVQREQKQFRWGYIPSDSVLVTAFFQVSFLQLLTGMTLSDTLYPTFKFHLISWSCFPNFSSVSLDNRCLCYSCCALQVAVSCVINTIPLPCSNRDTKFEFCTSYITL